MALSGKQAVFVEEYLNTFNATQAAIRAGYSARSARTTASELLAKPNIYAEVRRRISEKAMTADETLLRLGDQARADLGLFFKVIERDTLNPLPSEEILRERVEVKDVDGEQVALTIYTVKKAVIDMDKVIDPRYSVLLQEFTDSPKDGLGIKITNKMTALQTLAKIHRLDSEELRADQGESMPFELPAHMIAPAFIDAYNDIREHGHTEYVFYGGRGSTKSSFISLALVRLIKNNPNMHVLALRQVENTLRNSVYAQIVWAINELGLESEFKCTISPLEITYTKTGQRFYFRGADEPGKIKSIKPPFGYIGGLWYEELDQFKGPEAVRKITQSAVRGGDVAYIFASFNPPITAQAWTNKYLLVPKANQYQHKSTYLDLGSRIKWLGKPFIDEAEHLKTVNEKAYRHEYLGEITGTGGMVFENVQLREITDEEISRFDNVLHGLDFGWFPDPTHYGQTYYDAARRILYIFGEFRGWKLNSESIYKAIVENGYTNDQILIADSADQRTIGDLKAFGARVVGAEKPAGSRDYSYKWLQGLTAIVIDPVRCPYSANEFTGCEYERDPDGNFISAYPDKDDHGIDAAGRYSTNLIWRKRGQ